MKYHIQQTSFVVKLWGAPILVFGALRCVDHDRQSHAGAFIQRHLVEVEQWWQRAGERLKTRLLGRCCWDLYVFQVLKQHIAIFLSGDPKNIQKNHASALPKKHRFPSKEGSGQILERPNKVGSYPLYISRVTTPLIGVKKQTVTHFQGHL